MTADIRLIATDLDGTLIGHIDQLPLYTTYREALESIRRENGTVWVVCTGRTKHSFMAFFTPMRQFGITPDFVILRHAYIYGLTAFGYFPHAFWNAHIRHLIWKDRLNAHSAINRWHGIITRSATRVKTLEKKKNRLCMRFYTEDSAEAAEAMLREEIKPYMHLKVFRYAKDVDVREVPFTKGLALAALAKRLHVEPDRILAIGNGHNDLSMLDGAVAKLTGCPANSDAEVMEAVRASGGHIAKEHSLAGVVEILDAYTNGTVCSDLPANWQDPSSRRNPRPPERSRPRQSHQVRASSVCLVIGVVYAILVLLATYDLLPFGQGVVMKPIDWAVILIERIRALRR